MSHPVPPIVLSLSALDPSGCAGLQADIETAASLGCHCAPVATSLCSTGVAETSEVVPVDTTLIIAQARAVLEDMKVHAIKVGFAGSVRNIEAIHTILQDYPTLPLIIHPTFCLWDKDDPQQAEMPEAIASLLFPRADIAILTMHEINLLVKAGDTFNATAQAILNLGLRKVLLTESSPTERRWRTGLYDQSGLIQQYEWHQATPSCHGSSSTLTAAIAAFRAHDFPLQAAVEQAQNFTWQAMAAAHQLGFGKPTPHRFFWADENIEQPDTMPSGNPVH